MHSKGGYEHSSHVPSEATPSGKEVITIVSSAVAVTGWALIVDEWVVGEWAGMIFS